MKPVHIAIVLAAVVLVIGATVLGVFTLKKFDENSSFETLGGVQVKLSMNYAAVDRVWTDEEKSEAVDRAVAILASRFASAAEARVEVRRVPGENRIEMQLTDVWDFNGKFRLLMKPAILEFKLVVDDAKATSAIGQLDRLLEENLATFEGRYPALPAFREASYTPAGELFTSLTTDFGYPMRVQPENVPLLRQLLQDNDVRKSMPGGWEFLVSANDPRDPSAPRSLYLVESEAQLHGGYIKKADVLTSATAIGEPVIEITMTPEGTKMLETVTGQNINRRLAIVLDDAVLMAPVIRDKIRGKVQLSGFGSIEEAQQVCTALSSGSLDAPLVIEDVIVVEPKK